MKRRIRRRNPAVDRALHDHFLDLATADAIIGRGAQVKFQFAFAVHADQHSDGDQATGVPRQAWAGPDVAPGMAGDHLLEFRVELGQRGQAAIDVGITQYRAAHLHAFVVTLFLVHKIFLTEPAKTPALGR